MTDAQARTIATMVAALIILSLALMVTGCKNDPEPRPSYPKNQPAAPPGPSLPVDTTTPASVRYSSCAEARHAGAAPITQGQPGYHPRLDRNQNGVACE